MLCQLNISHRYKSSNFDSRKKKISFLIFHYTETDNLAKAIKLLTNKKSFKYENMFKEMHLVCFI